MIASISHIKEFMLCPQRAYNKYVLRRVGMGFAAPLELGTLIHKALERKVLGDTEWWDKTFDEANNHPLRVHESFDLVIDQFNVLCPVLEDWHLPGSYEVVDVEREMHIQLGNHGLVGRLDLILRDEHGLYHMNHKSLDDSKSVPNEIERLRTDWSEVAYGEMGAQAYPDEVWCGSIISIIRKISRKAILDPKRGPSTGWVIQPMMIDSDISARSLQDMHAVLDQMDIAYADPERLLRNRDACVHYGLCPYKVVCDGFNRLENPERYQSLEPRYADFNAS